MNIFISWSGDTSMKIASELKNFIPRILQSAKPYYTPSDIEKGTRWETEINQKLQECLVGLICLTPDNTEKPWIMFEAGALSNRLDKSKVCSILFDLKKADVTGPLSRFQMTDFNSSDFYKLAQSINSSMGEMQIADNVLKESFDVFYPIFEDKIQKILQEKKPDAVKPQRSERDILEEVLELVRKQNLNQTDKKGFSINSFLEKDEINRSNPSPKYNLGAKVVSDVYGIGKIYSMNKNDFETTFRVKFNHGKVIEYNASNADLKVLEEN